MADINFSIPFWLDKYSLSYQNSSGFMERMAFVIEAARKNVTEATGGPFAAAIFSMDDGSLISVGVNLVVFNNLSILHAEMVAIILAQKKLASYDLASKQQNYEMFSSCEPCAMCFGAIPWSGIRRLVTAATDRDARNIGFDEGPKLKDWQTHLTRRKIEVITDVMQAEAAEVMQYYAKQNGLIYNSTR